MESVGAGFLSQLLFAFSVILMASFFWITRRQDYFKKYNIPYVRSIPLLGAFGDALRGKIGFYDSVVEIYNKPEVKNEKFFGLFLFHKPGLMIVDPEIIKRILIKDFNKFANRYSASDVHDPLGYYNLFSVKAPLWKSLRGKLSPFFSSGKLKAMYYLLDKISDSLTQHVVSRLDENGRVELELKELASLYTTDVIASCAYGVEANSLENPKGEFRAAGASIFEMTFYRSLELPAFFMLPQVMKFFNFKTFSDHTTKFIESTISHVMTEREKQGNRRNDLIDTLIELKANGLKDVDEEELSMEMLYAQAAVFFSAGFETSSATNSFALYEVAMNEGVQDRLRGEIKDMLERTGGKITYDAVMNTNEMPYLHQVLMETLRLFPILPVIDRECIDTEGYSMKPFSDFEIPYGMPVWVPTFAIHRDGKNFPDPLKFDPERFSPENIDSIPPCTFFPFGTGPRNCIGERFALMQVKTGIVKILKDFRLEVNERTPKTIILEKNAMLVQSEKGLFVDLVKDPLF